MNTNKELQLVTFEQAKRLKELGYDWAEERYYVNREDRIFILQYDLNETNNPNSEESFYSAPTVALALEYIREEKGIKCCVEFYGKDKYTYTIYNKTGARIFTHQRFDVYKAAESALLDELLTLLEKEK